MSIGVPIKVLHEAEGHIITCETITGEVYRGKLIEAEDNMNCQMTQVNVTYRDGRTANLENVYIRGSKIRFLILPDMLKNAPMFKKQAGKGLGGTAGRGKAAILRAQGEYILRQTFIPFQFVIIEMHFLVARGRGRGGPGSGGGRGAPSTGAPGGGARGAWQGGPTGGRGRGGL